MNVGEQEPPAVTPVRSKAELLRFIRLPARLNAGDPAWITPLEMEREEALTPKTNPFFKHAEVEMWLATRGGRDVGRITAQIDQLAPTDPARPTGHFGMIAAEDDAEVFAALFAVAEDWLRARGRQWALGPFNLSVNEEVGLLVDGFDTPPMVLMGHDPRYAGARVEGAGYTKAKDVFAYLCNVSDPLPPAVRRRLDRGSSAKVTLRMLDMKRYDEEIRTLTAIVNDAWSSNWGFTPLTEAETRQLAKSLKPILDRRLIWFAEIDGEAAGFIVCLANVNEAIVDLGGKLLPFGWIKLLWRLKVTGVHTARVPLMGVKRKFAATLTGQMLPFLLIEAARGQARALGYDKIELSWILEDNT
ncbi:MAG: dATP pyrophosphohydrolase, partial [Caulobacteraceae bacterium]